MTIGPPTISLPAVFIHHFPFGSNSLPLHDPSQVTDFKGLVTNCRVTGRGTGIVADGTRSRLAFQVDNGFMQGEFIGLDGEEHEGTFGFT